MSAAEGWVCAAPPPAGLTGTGARQNMAVLSLCLKYGSKRARQQGPGAFERSLHRERHPSHGQTCIQGPAGRLATDRERAGGQRVARRQALKRRSRGRGRWSLAPCPLRAPSPPLLLKLWQRPRGRRDPRGEAGSGAAATWAKGSHTRSREAAAQKAASASAAGSPHWPWSALLRPEGSAASAASSVGMPVRQSAPSWEAPKTPSCM